VFTPNQHTDKLYNAFVQDEIPIVGPASQPSGLNSCTTAKRLRNRSRRPRLLWNPEFTANRVGRVTRAVRTPSRVEEDLQPHRIGGADSMTFSGLLATESFPRKAWLATKPDTKPGGAQSSTWTCRFYNNYDHLLSVEPGAPFSESSPPPPHTVIPFSSARVARPHGWFEIAPDWTPTRFGG